MDSRKVMEDGIEVLSFIKEYWTGILQKQVPVLPDLSIIKPDYLQHLLPGKAPEEGEDMTQILADCKQIILPGATHWLHPDFHACYPAGCSTASILGELLSGAPGVVPFTWASCPAATELEVVVLNWLAKALELPTKFLYDAKQHTYNSFGSGFIEITTSLATVTLTMALRNWVTTRYRQEADAIEDSPTCGGNDGAIVDRMTVYVSDQVNYSVQQAVALAMIQIRVIKSRRIGRRLVFDADDIQKAIQIDREKGLIPLMCIAILGTKNTCDFDDIQEIGTLCQKENIWLHVDAAYAGSALLCPEFRSFARGLEMADSICFNPHKLLLVNFDCAVLWVSNYKMLTATFGVETTYLQSRLTGMPDFKNWGVSLGRRDRSLKLWFVLRNLGLAELRRLIRKHHQLAIEFTRLIEKDPRFEIVNEVRFGLTCFRLKAGDEPTQELLNALLQERTLYLSAATLPEHICTNRGGYYLRFVSTHQASSSDVAHAAETIMSAASRVLLQCSNGTD